MQLLMTPEQRTQLHSLWKQAGPAAVLIELVVLCVHNHAHATTPEAADAWMIATVALETSITALKGANVA